MFSNYYEIEKMMQIRTEEALREAKQMRLIQKAKSRKTTRGCWMPMISLVNYIIRLKS